MNKKIADLRAQIREEEKKMANCHHEFGTPFFDPETVTEPYGYKTVGRGSDVWTEPEGFHEVQKKRWTRVCTKCGKEEHTYKQVPIVSGYQPEFK